MSLPATREIILRPTIAADLPSLFAFEFDPAANERAGTKPRDWSTFQARWAEILADTDGTRTRVVPRVILVDGELVGAVNISPQGDADSIGYWIAKEHWGRGIASRAVERMLQEFTRRPLYATVAASNVPSLRILEKFGFVIESRAQTPETGRCVARETVTFVLR